MPIAPRSIAALALAAFTASVVVACAGTGTSSTTKIESTPPRPTSVPTSTPARVLKWVEIARWEGKSIKDTETFTVPNDEWRLRWDTRPGQFGDMNFQIYVYRSDGTLIGVAANVIGKDTDNSVMRGKGNYYLTINTGQPYVIVAEAKQFVAAEPTSTAEPTPMPTVIPPTSRPRAVAPTPNVEATVAAAVAATVEAQPTPTPTSAPAPVAVPTATSGPLPTSTSTPTPSPTATAIPTATATPRPTPEPTPTRAPTATPTPSMGKWNTSSETNPLDDTTTAMALLKADSGEGTYGDPIFLAIRCRSNETNAYISWESYLGLDSPRVTYRIGSATAQSKLWSLSTNNQTTFYPGTQAAVIAFIKELMAADQFAAQVTPYSESPITAIFDPTGMENAAMGVKLACDWPVLPTPTPTPPEGHLVWRYKTGGVYSSPVVAGGVVYVRSGAGYVYALEAATGALVWRYKTGGVYSSPVVAGGVVYVRSGAGYVHALEAATGELIRRYGTGATDSAPAVAEGVVYVASQDGYVYALDGPTGDLLWSYTTGRTVSAPAVAEGVVYVGLGDYIHALDAPTGEVLWRYETGRTVSSPVVADGVVYAGSGVVYALDASTGDLLWRYGTGRSSPAVAGGVVYVGGGDYVDALNASTGDLVWRYERPLGTTYVPSGFSPAVGGGIVYGGSEDGYVYALDAPTGDLVWRYETGDAVHSSPAVAGGVVYVGSQDGYVYAIAAGRP